MLQELYNILDDKMIDILFCILYMLSRAYTRWAASKYNGMRFVYMKTKEKDKTLINSAYDYYKSSLFYEKLSIVFVILIILATAIKIPFELNASKFLINCFIIVIWIPVIYDESKHLKEWKKKDLEKEFEKEEIDFM